MPIGLTFEMPSKHLQSLGKYTDLNFTLAHMAGNNAYTDYYRASDKYTIVDNSNFELGSPLPPPKVLEAAQMYKAPKLVAGEIGVRDMEELSTYCQQLSMAGCQFFDKPTQNYLRKIARLPGLPDDNEDNVPPVPDASAPQDQNGPMPDPVKGAPPKPQPDLDQPGAKVPGAVPAVPRTRAAATPGT